MTQAPQETEGTLPFFMELLNPQARADPYPLYKRFRETDPVQRSDVGFWTLSRFGDILGVLTDPRFSADPRNATVISQLLGDDETSPIREGAGRVLLFTDPPDHTRLRSLVNKAFTRRVVEGLRPRVSELVDGMLEPISARGEMDVIADLAYPLPAVVICELIGVPTEDHALFTGWSGDVAPILDPMTPPDVMAKAVDTLGKFGEYFVDLIAKRRAEPSDDLVSALIAAEDDEDRLDEEELLSICGLTFIAGHETTQNLIGNGLMALLGHPDEMRRLRDDPSLIRNAVEELLRFDSPVQLTARSALEDIEVGGKTVAQGEEVIALIGAGNRDPAMFDDPERLDVGREKTQILSFGAGPHFCLGAPLARVEAQIVFAALLERFDSIELATDEPEWRDTLTLHGLRSLPVEVA